MKNLKIIETIKILNEIFFYHKKCIFIRISISDNEFTVLKVFTNSMLKKSRVNNMINIHIKEVIK